MDKKIHVFTDGNIVTERHFNGMYSAKDETYDVTRPVGFGRDRYDAIKDFVGQMRERGLLTESDDEPFDKQSAAWDHARDLRKHT